MDATIAADDARSGAEDIDASRASATGARRPRSVAVALMPWFWTTLAPAGMVLGNQSRGSKVTVRNPHVVLLPGYSEILTGQPQPDVQRNDLVRYPHQTVLDYVTASSSSSRRRSRRSGPGTASRWPLRAADGSFFMNGAFEPVPACAQHARDGSTRLVAQGSHGALGGKQQRYPHLPHRPRVPAQARAAVSCGWGSASRTTGHMRAATTSCSNTCIWSTVSWLSSGARCRAIDSTAIERH